MDYNVPQLTPRQVATLPYNGGMNAKFIAGGAGILASRLRGAPAPRVLVSAPRRNPFRIPRSTFRFPLSAFRFQSVPRPRPRFFAENMKLDTLPSLQNSNTSFWHPHSLPAIASATADASRFNNLTIPQFNNPTIPNPCLEYEN